MLPNLYSALSKYGSKEAENYLTESLVFLLSTLLQKAPSQGLWLLNNITGPLPLHRLSRPAKVSLTTQVTVERGRPDIEVAESTDTLVYVEIKHDSELGENQLEYYYSKLEESDRPNRRLVFLSRSKASAVRTSLGHNQFFHICWYDVFDWLNDFHGADPIVDYLVANFQEFLQEKKMSVRKVTWEFEQGIATLVDFTTMLEVAIREAVPTLPVKKTAGWSWRGFYLDGSIFCGIRYDKPMILALQNNFGTNPTASEALDLVKTHFLALPKDEQLELLVGFLAAAAPKVPKGDSGAIPPIEESAA